MYKEYTIFDMPIYLLSEAEYHNKTSKKCENYSSKSARNITEFYGMMGQCISDGHKYNPWRYNLIVGAIRISITDDECIELKLYFIEEKKTKYNSKTKHIIKDCCLPDRRVKKVLSYKTDGELKKQLQYLIDDTIKNYVNNGSHKYFVDLESYNNLIQHIDLKKIVKKINSMD